MKLTSVPFTLSSFDRIRPSDSGRDAPKREQPRKDTPQDESPADGEFSSELAEKKLDTAVEAFAKESSAVSNDLNASVEGQGPGLRVTLKDGYGSMVRQFTGEEFLRLREAATGARGRLLDKKI